MCNISSFRFLLTGLLLLIGSMILLSQESVLFRIRTNAAAAPIAFRWSMRERFGTERADGLIDFHWTSNTQEYADTYVNPQSWTVDFDACGTVPSTAELRWEIDGQPVAETRCSFSHDFAEQLRDYVVTLTATTPDGQSSSAQATVKLRDLLIISIGDSFASGEGNPDKRDKFHPARWIDKRCHRSAWAGPARAAIIIEKANPKTSVTFLSFACTGASIREGLLGVQRRQGEDVAPQLDKVFATVKRRTIDALLISVGGNDISFATLVQKAILLKHADTNETTNQIVRDGLRDLPALFESVSQRLNSSTNEASIASVFISEYPDVVRDENKNFCNQSLVFSGGPVGRINEAESEWALNSVIVPLNQVVREQAARFGWNYVDGILNEFGGASGEAHGFCAENPWVNILIDSLHAQLGVRGTIHPNRDGHLWYARRLVEELNTKHVTDGAVP